MITEYAVPSLALNYHYEKYQIIYERYLCICTRNKYSCKSDCVKSPHTSNAEGDQYFNSQHAWAMFRHGCQRHSFLNSQTDSRMYTFPDQMNWQFVQILMDSQFQSKLRVLDTDDVKRKPSLFSVLGKSAGYVFMVTCSFVLCHLCLVHKINAQTPITAILSTYLIIEFLMNVKCRMDGSHGKPYICLSFDFLIQYSANGTCLTSVNMQEYVTSLWLLWNSYIFSDLFWDSLTWLTGND